MKVNLICFPSRIRFTGSTSGESSFPAWMITATEPNGGPSSARRLSCPGPKIILLAVLNSNGFIAKEYRLMPHPHPRLGLPVGHFFLPPQIMRRLLMLGKIVLALVHLKQVQPIGIILGLRNIVADVSRLVLSRISRIIQRRLEQLLAKFRFAINGH